MGVAVGLLADLLRASWRAVSRTSAASSSASRSIAAARPPRPALRWVLPLGEVLLQVRDPLSELRHATLGLAEAAAEAGLLGRELAHPGVDRVLVVAAAADHGEPGGRGGLGARGRPLRREGAGCGDAAGGGITGAWFLAAGSSAAGVSVAGSGFSDETVGITWVASSSAPAVASAPGSSSKMDSPWSVMKTLPLCVAFGSCGQRLADRWRIPTPARDICRRTGVDGKSCQDSAGGSDPAEAVDRLEVLVAEVGVADAEALAGGQAEDADLALVLVVVDVQRGLADLVEGVGPRQRRVDLALGDQAVGLPRLAGSWRSARR